MKGNWGSVNYYLDGILQSLLLTQHDRRLLLNNNSSQLLRQFVDLISDFSRQRGRFKSRDGGLLLLNFTFPFGDGRLDFGYCEDLGRSSLVVLDDIAETPEARSDAADCFEEIGGGGEGACVVFLKEDLGVGEEGGKDCVGWGGVVSELEAWNWIPVLTRTTPTYSFRLHGS